MRALPFRGRSNGRTAGFGPVDRGSSPLPGTSGFLLEPFYDKFCGDFSDRSRGW